MDELAMSGVKNANAAPPNVQAKSRRPSLHQAMMWSVRISQSRLLQVKYTQRAFCRNSYLSTAHLRSSLHSSAREQIKAASGL